MARKRAELAARGVDPERLPAGQYVTERFPLLHLGPVPEPPPHAEWSLRIGGDGVRRPVTLSWAELLALGTVDVTADIHCVTKWTRLDVPWTGVRLHDVLAVADPTGDATTLLAHDDRGYSASIALADLEGRDDALVAWAVDGEPLTTDHGGPLRLVIPHRYFWKSVKWLRAVELWRAPVLGFWERHGYHHRGDPFAQERHWGDDAAADTDGAHGADTTDATGTPLGRPLRELLVRVLAATGGDVRADVDRLREALQVVLRKVLSGADGSWPSLVAAAAERGAWDRWRVGSLLDAARPADDPQPEVTRDVLAEVAEELAERGDVLPGPWEGTDVRPGPPTPRGSRAAADARPCSRSNGSPSI